MRSGDQFPCPHGRSGACRTGLAASVTAACDSSRVSPPVASATSRPPPRGYWPNSRLLSSSVPGDWGKDCRVGGRFAGPFGRRTARGLDRMEAGDRLQVARHRRPGKAVSAGIAWEKRLWQIVAHRPVSSDPAPPRSKTQNSDRKLHFTSLRAVFKALGR
jgi:hypothetical protein